MKKMYLIFLLLIPSFSSAGMKGTDLVEYCAQALQCHKCVDDKTCTKNPNDFLMACPTTAGYCTGFILGVMTQKNETDALIMANKLQNAVKLGKFTKNDGVCVTNYLNATSDIPSLQMTNIVYTYLQANPSLLDIGADKLVIASMRRAYPLPQQCAQYLVN